MKIIDKLTFLCFFIGGILGFFVMILGRFTNGMSYIGLFLCLFGLYQSFCLLKKKE